MRGHFDELHLLPGFLVIAQWETLCQKSATFLLESPGPKNLRTQINQFHEKKLFFAISKMAKNQFLNWEKV